MGMFFGVVDGFHPGHAYFLSEAAKKCRELVVVVTRDETVEILKKRRPKNSLDERTTKIGEHDPSFIVVPGDETPGEWRVLEDNDFDIVFLGYDQHGIAAELDKMSIPYEFLDSHHPELYKSSLPQQQ